MMLSEIRMAKKTDTEPVKRGRRQARKQSSPEIVSRPASNNDPDQLKRWLRAGVVIVVVLGISLLTWQYLKARSDVKRLSGSSNSAVDQDIITHVSKLTIVPGNEKPTIAVISDISKFKDQPLFNLAQNGDKVVVYKSGREIVYRPSTNQIITVVTIPQNNTSGQ